MARPDELLPTHLISFDEVSQATLTVLCEGRAIEPLQAADPWLHRLRRGQAQSASKESQAEASAKNVLFTLQWGYDGERESLSSIIPNGVMHPALEALFAETANTGLRFQLRMHPVQMNAPGYRHHRRHIESLVARFPHLEFERASTLPLPVLLDTASAHMTLSSSAVGEAAVAGVPSLMLCPTLKPGGAHAGFFRELEASGSVTFGDLHTAAIRAWIEACPRAADRGVRAYDAEGRHAEALAFYAQLIGRVTAAAPATSTVNAAGTLCKEAI